MARSEYPLAINHVHLNFRIILNYFSLNIYDLSIFDNETMQKLILNENVKIKNIMYTYKSTPLLVTEEDFLTANKDFIKVI